MYMKANNRVVHYGIALALFGILVFSLMASVEGMTSMSKATGAVKKITQKTKEKEKVKSKEPQVKEVPVKKTTPNPESSNEGFDSNMLTKEEAEKMISKLIEDNKKKIN